MTTAEERLGQGAVAPATLSGIEPSAHDALAGRRVERSYLVGGRHVRLVFAGDALVDKLTRGFRHLAHAAERPPDLTLVAWDSASTGVPAPPLPADGDPDGPMWRRVLVDEPPLHGVFKPGPGTLSVVDKSRDLAWYWCADAGAVPPWEEGTPFLHVFHHWLSSRGMQLVHAGATGLPSGGVLFVGKSGSGKSTSTLACVTSGLLYGGDDYVVIAAEPEPVVHALYSSGKLDDHQLPQFPELARRVVNPDSDAGEKRVFFLGDDEPDRAFRSLPLRAVLLPRVTGRRDTRLVPASSAAALAALAPSTIFQMPGAAGAELSAIAALLRDLPAYVLEAGTDLAGVAAAVRALLEGDAP